MTGNDEEISTIPIQIARDWLESTARGQTGCEIDRQALQNLYSVHVQKGLIQCNFIVPKSLSDRDGNWRVGAIATLIDLIGASVDLNISFFSTVKVQRLKLKYWEIKRNLFSFTVVIKKKEHGDLVFLFLFFVLIQSAGLRSPRGDLVAIGKQWISLYDLNHKSKL
ncbi:hypothetical protein MKW98_029978 [Papaver atlanticum]|uniref:Uncharacterized protein n=1 Tax=Papaver atlanticum TaxID=357466 RepID=A0AAD4XIQ4_9MAGN|nr:hypothetical protein MKW98_029978 [Papaver atlanticum]